MAYYHVVSVLVTSPASCNVREVTKCCRSTFRLTWMPYNLMLSHRFTPRGQYSYGMNGICLTHIVYCWYSRVGLEAFTLT